MKKIIEMKLRQKIQKLNTKVQKIGIKTTTKDLDFQKYNSKV